MSDHEEKNVNQPEDEQFDFSSMSIDELIASTKEEIARIDEMMGTSRLPDAEEAEELPQEDAPEAGEVSLDDGAQNPEEPKQQEPFEPKLPEEYADLSLDSDEQPEQDEQPQRAHLAAEPRNAALGGGVGVLQRRDGIMPDAVARIDVLVVRLIPDIVLPQRGTVCLGVGAGQAEAGPHIAAAARRNAGQPVQTRAARHTEKHRFSLVGHRVGRGNDGLLPRGQLIEPAVAQTAGPILARAGRHLYAFLHGVIQEQLHAVPAAEVRHKVGITAGGLAPDAVVDVGRQYLDLQRAAMAQ